jgi:hypothetical protein
VLLLITLLITLYLNEAPDDAGHPKPRCRAGTSWSRPAPPWKPPGPSCASVRLQAAALTNRVFVVPEADRSGKEPVLIVLSDTNGLVHPAGANSRPSSSYERADNADFQRMLDNWDPHKDRLVFYIRPSAVLHFRACESTGRQPLLQRRLRRGPGRPALRAGHAMKNALWILQ